MAHDLIAKGLSEGMKGPHRTGADVLSKMSESMFGANDPDTLFYKWMADAMAGDGIRAEAEKMGLDVPEGPGFAKRLRDAYLEKAGISHGDKGD